TRSPPATRTGTQRVPDADTLRRDPALKLAVGRSPVSDPDLASQPTLSRLEQTVSEAECAAMNEVLLWHFLQLPRKAPREVVLDRPEGTRRERGSDARPAGVGALQRPLRRLLLLAAARLRPRSRGRGR